MSTTWTLLITDDCQEDREVYREYLSSDPQQSYQFIEAGSAEAGLALCEQQRYDAILLDFCLPDMTGLEFLEALQQRFSAAEDMPNLPIIMLTGQGDERVAVQAMKRGVQDYLVKQDLNPDTLQLTVRNVIEQFHCQPPPSPQLSEALSALETEKQLSALKSQLVATVSHEYRSPLAAILAAASTLKLHGDKLQDVKQQQFLHLIENKARQMTHLVENLLALDTFEAGQTHFAPLPLELLQFISDLVEEQRQSIATAHELTFKISGNTKGFRGDQLLLRLILLNLLSNAIKYSPAGGAIEVHLVGSETEITIAVKDEGIGIPPAEQAQIFQSFQRGSNIAAIPGSGVGLAIVKTCVDLHGGKVKITSQVDQGTTVTIGLPKLP
jgi:signal transduction histidine kinase